MVGPSRETLGGQGLVPSRWEAEGEDKTQLEKRKKIAGKLENEEEEEEEEEEEYLPLWLRMSGGEETDEGASGNSNLRQRRLDLRHPVLNGSSHVGVVNKEGVGAVSEVLRRASDSRVVHQAQRMGIEDFKFYSQFGEQGVRSRGHSEPAHASNSNLRERVLAASGRLSSGANESALGGGSLDSSNSSQAGLWSRADTPKQQAPRAGGSTSLSADTSLGQSFPSPNARHLESRPWDADTATTGWEGSHPRKLQATNSARPGTNGPTRGSSEGASQSVLSSPGTSNLSSPGTSNLRAPSVTPSAAPPAKQRPIIFPISSTALQALIPLSGSGNQVLQCLGGPLDWFRRLVLSLSAAVVLYNVSPLATIVAAFYWAWAPIWSAAISNMELRRKYPYAGLWIGRVLKTITEKLPNGQRQWRLIIGDKAGVRVEVCTEIPSLPMKLARGEPVQMVALSDTEDFSRFKILREAFLPRRGVWLAEEAAVERPVFECLQVHLVPSVLNKLPAEDDEDWDSMFSLMCDETTETLRQYSYEDDPRGYNAETMPYNLYEGPPGGSVVSEMQIGDDIAIHALLSDGQEAEIRDQFRD